MHGSATGKNDTRMTWVNDDIYVYIYTAVSRSSIINNAFDSTPKDSPDIVGQSSNVLDTEQALCHNKRHAMDIRKKRMRRNKILPPRRKNFPTTFLDEIFPNSEVNINY